MKLPRSLIVPASRAVFPPVLVVSALLLGGSAPGSILSSLAAAVAATGLVLLGARMWAAIGVGAMMILALYQLNQGFYSFGWIAFMIAMGVPARARAPITEALSKVPANGWASVVAVMSAMLAGATVLTGQLAFITHFAGSLCAALLAFEVGRRLFLFDAPSMASDDPRLGQVTRELLLGRITSGMLHDLSQPLNIISMANGNIGYIIDLLEIDDERREQLLERTRRIGAQTDRAAEVLSLFRWFGRDGSRDKGPLTVGSALERAVAATFSDLRHDGVKVEIRGDALDYPVLLRHGTVEMLAVAALLSASHAFPAGKGRQVAGNIVLDARQTERDIVITLTCTDAEGARCATGEIDPATMWLVEQIAREGRGDFRRISKRHQPLCFVIRFSLDTI